VELSPQKKEKDVSSVKAKIISQPIRSGQQIYAKEGDLIILASVSPGAEVLADGNIHIYGALKGRALAGVSGNKEARIFCQKLEAELVSIAGHYWVNEDLSPLPSGQTIQIYLENDRLHIGTF
jgi:septum site-determining protein MinC